MYIRITRPVRVTVFNHNVETGEDDAQEVAFREGAVLLVGEVSPAGDETTLELVPLGYADLPNDCWEPFEQPVFLLRPYDLSPPN